MLENFSCWLSYFSVRCIVIFKHWDIVCSSNIGLKHFFMFSYSFCVLCLKGNFLSLSLSSELIREIYLPIIIEHLYFYIGRVLFIFLRVILASLFVGDGWFIYVIFSGYYGWRQFITSMSLSIYDYYPVDNPFFEP